MGQSGAKLTSSSDWTVEEEEEKGKSPPIGTDATYREGDLLKFTDATVEYDKSPLQPVKEELPVEGAFLVHNLLSPTECEQYIKISEEVSINSSSLILAINFYSHEMCNPIVSILTHIHWFYSVNELHNIVHIVYINNYLFNNNLVSLITHSSVQM
jgi:hypothetical protein